VIVIGVNYNRGQKICLRLRYPSDRNQFLPIEQVVDTMLHELSHNVHGPHDAKFHALWNQLRDEHEGLVMKGYTGEGFLSEGHRLGGGRNIPMHEARRLARASAEKRRTLAAGSGQRLGGIGPRPGQDIRRTIVNAVERRNNTLQGCAHDTYSADEIREIADTASRNGFKTQAEEDAANDAAIAQALWELVQEDEKAKYGNSYLPATAGDPTGNGGGSVLAHSPTQSDIQERWSKPQPRRVDNGVGKPIKSDVIAVPTSWTCQICTLENPLNYLCCDACGTERAEVATKNLKGAGSRRQRPTVVDLTTSPDLKASRAASSSTKPSTGASASTQASISSSPKTWTCSFCGRVRDWNFWTCDLCGKVKESS
jgi:hypothetical protein